MHLFERGGVLLVYKISFSPHLGEIKRGREGNEPWFSIWTGFPNVDHARPYGECV